MSDAAVKLAEAIMNLVEDTEEDLWERIPLDIRTQLECEIYDLAEQVKKDVRDAS